jgi:hypothetical protein
MEEPPRVWRTGAFAGQFGDAYLENTELEGGQMHASIRTLVVLLSEMPGLVSEPPTGAR